MKTSLPALSSLPQPEFVALVGPAFEKSPWIAERTWDKWPFASVEELHARLVETVSEATPEEQLALINAHPDLVGRAARAGTLTPESAREQAGAGLGGLSKEEIRLFDEYNAAYRAKFGFPFVICARENKKESILAAFPVRLGHTHEEEVSAALAEIAKIAWLRLVDIVGEI